MIEGRVPDADTLTQLNELTTMISIVSIEMEEAITDANFYHIQAGGHVDNLANVTYLLRN